MRGITVTYFVFILYICVWVYWGDGNKLCMYVCLFVEECKHMYNALCICMYVVSANSTAGSFARPSSSDKGSIYAVNSATDRKASSPRRHANTIFNDGMYVVYELTCFRA